MSKFWQNWAVITLFGAILNAVTNYGYKIIGSDGGIIWVIASITGIASILCFMIARLSGVKETESLFAGKMPLVILLLGTVLAAVFICFLTALSIGPISLIDPMWACIYSVTSLAIGMIIIRERPSAIALTGIFLYLAGAVLMGMGGRA